MDLQGLQKTLFTDPTHCQWPKVLTVLIWAGIELIFFMLASVGLCFRFVLETVLRIQGYFSVVEWSLQSTKALSTSSRHSTSEGAGDAQGVWRGHSQDS